ncbi:transcription factor SRM1-like [Magnolia sinica]|nr:transcription factor SRM1-like [Magnolia sinica]XP_058089285.1 transcription factor SRM1-like [Magnolia sinica]XP_058089286.1 transcription factor SRM1-like [Magnolia sinica]
MSADETSSGSSWSREQDNLFEEALVSYPEDCSDRWEKIAAAVPGKTIDEIKQHYELLVEDINNIEAGLVPLPCYASSSEGSADHEGEGGAGRKAAHFGNFQNDSSHGGKASRSDQERRKGIAWTEDEHR